MSGEWIARGFERLGKKVTTTSGAGSKGDITVVHGPNYAKQGKTGNVLWLDRCWYGNHEEWVTLGWKTSETTRKFADGDSTRFMWHEEMGIVEIEPMRRSGGTIALDDYQQTVKSSPLVWDTYRGHPAREKHTTTLYQAMQGHMFAVCGYGTCAAQAKLAGLHVTCLDPDNIAQTDKRRESWAYSLAWTQFHRREIESGFALEALCALL